MDDLENIDSFESQNNSRYKSVPNSTTVLVLGILSIVGCLCYGIVGIILGIIALSLHKKDKELYESNPVMYADSFKNSRAGNICAIIGLSLSVLFFLLVILAVITENGNVGHYRSW